MPKRLHSRLLFSYVAILLTVLAVVGLALLGFAAVSGVRFLQPLQRLSTLSAATRTELARQARAGATLPQLSQALSGIAAEQEVRILIANAATRQVVFDSDPGQSWLGLDISDLASPPRLFVNTQPDSVAGLFRHPETGQNWVVYGQSLTEASRLMVYYAQPPPTTIAFFREFFWRPLCGAGFIALFLAIVLAFGIARSVARPLRRLADAAEAVAAGHYDQAVTPSGPEEVQRVATSFNSMAAQVKMTQQAQRDFVANVSHDLKTPITAITGWSQALLDGMADTPEAQQRAAGIIHSEADRMARMVTQLLDLARLESGQIELAQEPVDMRQLLTAVHHNLAPRADAAGVHLTQALEPVPQITGDADRLMQVFTNLVDNALTHTPRHGRVHLALKRHGEKAVEASVQDTGSGIPPDDLSRVFERFYQVDKSRQRGDRQPGSGLGLAIVRELVAAHGGRIAAHSQVGKGSLFVVRLPVTQAGEPSTVIKAR